MKKYKYMFSFQRLITLTPVSFSPSCLPAFYPNGKHHLCYLVRQSLLCWSWWPEVKWGHAKTVDPGPVERRIHGQAIGWMFELMMWHCSRSAHSQTRGDILLDIYRNPTVFWCNREKGWSEWWFLWIWLGWNVCLLYDKNYSRSKEECSQCCFHIGFLVYRFKELEPSVGVDW